MPLYDTIEFKKKYKSLDDTLYWLVQQSINSVPYCKEFLNADNLTPKEIWYKLKPNLHYQSDKRGIEQIQSTGTLFENNIHGKPGHGDCDCFTVATISMLLASNKCNHNDINIYLQGNKAKYPSHILTKYKHLYFDFTQPHFNTIRNYKYYDCINIKEFL